MISNLNKHKKLSYVITFISTCHSLGNLYEGDDINLLDRAPFYYLRAFKYAPEEKIFFPTLKKHKILMIYTWNSFVAVAYCIKQRAAGREVIHKHGT